MLECKRHVVIHHEYELLEGDYSDVTCIHMDRLGFDPYAHTELDQSIMARTLSDTTAMWNCDEYDNLKPISLK